MGSGVGTYTGTGGSSQPFSSEYHVERAMHQYDIDNGVYHDGRYDVNPTARPIESMINGNYIVGKGYNDDSLTYVIDKKGNIIVGKRNGNGRNGVATPHPTLIGGKDPVVQMAGMLKVRGGKIYSYDNRSGHFKPNIQSMRIANEAFAKLSPQLFHNDFKGRK